MPRIVVDPDHLRQASARLQQATDELQQLGQRVNQAAGMLDWEVRQQADMGGEIARAHQLAQTLGGGAETLAHFLARKADAFAAADQQGGQGLGQISSTFNQMQQAWMQGSGGGYAFPYKQVGHVLELGQGASDTLSIHDLVQYGTAAGKVTEVAAKLAILYVVTGQLTHKNVTISLPFLPGKRFGINFKRLFKQYAGLKGGTTVIGKDNLTSKLVKPVITRITIASAVWSAGTDIYKYRNDPSKAGSAVAVDAAKVGVVWGAGMVGSTVGGAIGGAVGAGAGAVVGSIIPVAGTAAGGAVGGVIGETVGGVMGGAAASYYAGQAFDAEKDTMVNFVDHQIVQPIAHTLSSIAHIPSHGFGLGYLRW